jgi:hypothetical protein
LLVVLGASLSIAFVVLTHRQVERERLDFMCIHRRNARAATLAWMT